MKLLTEEIKAKLPACGETDGKNPKDIPIIAKFFTPDSNWTWYVTEGWQGRGKDYFEDEDDFYFFGMVHGFEKELGYFTLNQLKEVRGPLGLSIERDLHYEGHMLSEVMP